MKKFTIRNNSNKNEDNKVILNKTKEEYYNVNRCRSN